MSNLDNQAAHPKDLERAVDIQKIIELRIEGKSYREIQDLLGISKSHCQRLAVEGHAILRAHMLETVQSARDLECARLDAIVSALWDKRSKVAAAGALVRISQRRAELLGLDAPKTFKELPPGPDLPEGFDFTKLTVDQLRDLEKIAESARVDVVPAVEDVAG